MQKPIIEMVKRTLNSQIEDGAHKAVVEMGFKVDKDRLWRALTDAGSFFDEGFDAAIPCRCMDCKHGDLTDYGVECIRGEHPIMMDLEDYCSRGEWDTGMIHARRED